ncbi:MAG: (2Fe-2S)-binding protein [Deltaproteobacteria bacterium]|nr:(2Fe-2S)-binding protein [Deltaproteobacteria bacterium]
MKVNIDGRSINLHSKDKNIVNVASRAKIGIPAPCYLAKRNFACCNACVIEVDGHKKYACSTPPKDGMNITINREDLKSLRKQRLLRYKEGIINGRPLPCSSMK